MKRIMILFIMVIMLTACGQQPTPQPTAVPQMEKEIFTVEQLNEINKILGFKLKGEYPEIRALLYRNRFNAKEEISMTKVAEAMSMNEYGERFLDNENPYLTAEDRQELQLLKAEGCNLPYEKIESGDYIYGRIPYENVSDLIKKYMGISDGVKTQEPVQVDYTPTAYCEKTKIYYCCLSATDNDGNILLNGYVYDSYPEILCIYGEKTGDTVTLHTKQEQAVFVKEGDNYYLQSFTTLPQGKDYTSTGGDSTYNRAGTPVENFVFKYKETFTPADGTKSAEYNNVMKIYNDFLSENARTQHRYDGIYEYALYDFTGDNLPELITHSSYEHQLQGPNWDMYTVAGGKIKSLDLPGGRDKVLLNNNMIANVHHSTGTTYDFYCYNADGTYKAVRLFDGSPGDLFVIGEEELSQDEFFIKANYYLKRLENKADVSFIDVYDYIEY